MITSSQYHDQASYARHNLSGHCLDWDNQPSVYKTYPGITPVRLIENPILPQVSLSQILKEQKAHQNNALPTLEDLSQIFRLTCSLTAKTVSSGGTFFYRSVASAGALYPTEIYLVMPKIQDLNEGLYHYSVAHPGLSPLREGNFFPFLRSAGQWPDGFQPGVVFLFTAIFFRSAWKYRDRAFRYHLLDAGHLIENLLLALKAKNRSPALTYDFDDPAINRFLGLDTTREGLLALVSIPGLLASEQTQEGPLSEVSKAVMEASRVSRHEVSYPTIQEIYRSGWEIVSKKKPPLSLSQGINLPVRQWTSTIPAPSMPEKMDYPSVVLSRRSKRNFIGDPISSQAFLSIIKGLSVDILGTHEVPKKTTPSLTMGLLIGQVEGVSSGFYLLDRKSLQLGLIKDGLFLKSMAQVCLDQMWLANAGLHCLFLTNLDILDQNWGPRGYRYAMMSAGRLGERLYLLCSALGLGCCGIGAFYDQEASELLELDETSRLLYLVAVGSIKQKKMVPGLSWPGRKINFTGGNA